MLIGVDFGGTKIEAAALEADGVMLARERVATPRDYSASLEAVAALVAGLERRFGPADGVGVGTPGSASPQTGLMRNANSTWLNGRPMPQDLEELLGRPVRVENDANCLAVSEATDGAGAGAHVVFAVILGTGCGAGIAIGGRPHAGRNGVAGEFGHNPLPWPQGAHETPGKECWCGRRGCNETYLSGPGLAAAHEAEGGRAMTAEEIASAALAGDAAAAGAIDRYAGRLARALGAVVNLLDPDVIVLGGGVSNIPAIYDGLTGRMAAHVFADSCGTPVRRAMHGDSSGVRGAAWLWKP